MTESSTNSNWNEFMATQNSNVGTSLSYGMLCCQNINAMSLIHDDNLSYNFIESYSGPLLPLLSADLGAESYSGPLLPLLSADLGAEASNLSTKLVEKPEWLPEEWKIKCETRLAGATKGRIDKYYISPMGTKFRSKPKVLHFLETESRKKRPLNPESGSGSTPAKEKPDRSVRKKISKENGKDSSQDFSNLDFDLKNPPQSTTWVPKDEADEEWTPVVENAVVPETDQSQWSNAFGRLTELEKSDGVVL